MKESHFLDVFIKILNNELVLDIYHKPTNSFGYLRYTSCHPPHTKKNIAKSLGKRIVRIVSHNRERRINELQTLLRNRGHPKRVIEESLASMFQPEKGNQNQEIIPFVHTFNPNHKFDRDKIKNFAKKSTNDTIRRVFDDCGVVMATRQPKNLKKMLTRAKFQLHPPLMVRKPAGLFPCGNCTYCERGYIVPATEFVVRSGGNVFTWRYTRHFTCDSVNLLYVLKNDYDENFYLGKTKSAKKRMGKHISDVFHPHNSNCKVCSRHLGNVSGMIEPFFRYYPFFYEDDPGMRDFMEKRFTRRWKPQLNSYNTV